MLPSVFSDQTKIKLEINKKNTRKITNNWKLKVTFYNNP